jgi:ribosomal protein S13
MIAVIMSEFAFFRFRSNNMLTIEEEQHKDEIINLTEVLDAKGMECDSKISKISEEQLREILDEVRKLRRKRKRLLPTADNNRTSSDIENEEVEHQMKKKSHISDSGHICYRGA